MKFLRPFNEHQAVAAHVENGTEARKGSAVGRSGNAVHCDPSFVALRDWLDHGVLAAVEPYVVERVIRLVREFALHVASNLPSRAVLCLAGRTDTHTPTLVMALYLEDAGLDDRIQEATLAVFATRVEKQLPPEIRAELRVVGPRPATHVAAHFAEVVRREKAANLGLLELATAQQALMTLSTVGNRIRTHRSNPELRRIVEKFRESDDEDELRVLAGQAGRAANAEFGTE